MAQLLYSNEDLEDHIDVLISLINSFVYGLHLLNSFGIYILFLFCKKRVNCVDWMQGK